MCNGHIRPRDVSGESCLTVTNTLVPYILSLIYAVPRVHRLSPTHSCRIYCLSYMRCLVSTVCHQHTSANSNQLQLIATDTPNTFYIASPPDSNEASSLTFCKHPHYLIRLISFELFVTITLPPLSRQGIEIIPYIKRF
jgi:hypothetical protein